MLLYVYNILFLRYIMQIYFTMEFIIYYSFFIYDKSNSKINKIMIHKCIDINYTL